MWAPAARTRYDEKLTAMDLPPKRVVRFWNRVTEGAATQQLWAQFRADAQATYKFYAADSDLGRRNRGITIVLL